jgi:hypothetical protein
MYYLTTLAAWQRQAHRFAGSHWIALEWSAPSQTPPGVGLSTVVAPPAAFYGVRRLDAALTPLPSDAPSAEPPGEGNSSFAPQTDSLADATPILVLIEADEGAHLALESDADFHALPHPLSQKPISEAAQSALALFGVASGATTFDAAETLGRVHPLLRHRVF